MQSWNLIIDKLMTKNCLLFGQHSKFTSKKVTRYLLGTRDTTEIFKLYELRYLLLKIYPLIHNLFNNPRINSKLKSQTCWDKPTRRASQRALPLIKNRNFYAKSKRFFKHKFSFLVKQRNIPPQILFASVTPTFSDIIYTASQICNMPWHKNRWLSGSITAALTHPADKFGWQYLQDLTQRDIFQAASAQWGRNKENEEKIKEKIKHYNRSRWPSLLVIPDVSNNTMILKEARTVGLPVIGLVNSNCLVEIDYPIFAQDQTLQSVHFFCHFLAILIAKETVFVQHKRYTLQKALQKAPPKIYSPKELKELLNNKQKFFVFRKVKRKIKRKAHKKIFFSRKKKFKLEVGVKFQKFRATWKKPFFFKIVRPWQEKIAQRYFLSRNLRAYSPFFSNKFRYRNYRKRQARKKFASRKKILIHTLFEDRLRIKRKSTRKLEKLKSKLKKKLFLLKKQKNKLRIKRKLLVLKKQKNKLRIKNKVLLLKKQKNKLRIKNKLLLSKKQKNKLRIKKTLLLLKKQKNKLRIENKLLRFTKSKLRIKKELLRFKNFKSSKNFKKLLFEMKKGFKKQLKPFKRKKRKASSFTIEKNLFHNEYKKKYFQKNKQPTPKEKKQIRQKLRNFLWFLKMRTGLKTQRRFSITKFSFRGMPYYFKHSLHQWAQHTKLNNHRQWLKQLLELSFQEKRENRKAKWKNNWKHNWKNKYHLSKKAYKHKHNYKHKHKQPINDKHRKTPTNPRNKWGAWVTRNQPKPN